MALATIQVNGSPLQVVVLPPLGLARSVEFSFSDAVAMNRSPFTGVTQTYVWPGADTWCSAEKPGTVTYPPLQQNMADWIISALMECRGMSVPFLLWDFRKPAPAGSPEMSVPLVDNSTTVTNVAGTTMLATKGWKVSTARLLLPGDYVQVGYRLHRVLDFVASDANGKAVLNLWPSLRELPADGLPLKLTNPKGTAGLASAAGPVGLFRRAGNVETWSSDVSKLTNLSFQFCEYR